ncbi:DASS family transporter: sodium ion/sulfate, partial [Ostreococcus lucimarinus CCE9901]
LLRDYVAADWTMMLAVATLNLCGVITLAESLAGFANEGLLTVGALFVVAAGISATGGLDWYMGKVLGKPRTPAGAQLRLMLPIACVSGFLNNTPVVAVMIPIVLRWAEATGMAKEQLMIPLSFASVLGGTCTLIGTSTNLVVQGMVETWTREHAGRGGEVKIGLFDLGLYGVPVALAGIAYVLLASPFLLPKGARRIGSGPRDQRRGEDEEDLLVGARVEGWSPAVGHTVAASGLRGLPGLYLVSVRRNQALLRAIGPEFILNQGDILYFTGMIESLGKVLRRVPGLAPYSSDQVDKLEISSHDRRLIQAVVAKTGDLVGKSIRDIKFRTRFNAVVIAVHREGARVHSRIGDVVLHPGDVLLLDAGEDFKQSARAQGAFALISVLDDSTPPRLRLLIPSLLCALAMISLYTAGVMELFTAAVLAAAVMIASGTLTQQEARNAIKWDVIVTIAGAFGISRAMQNSGVAEAVAKKLVALGRVTNTGEIGLLVAVYLATFLISNIVTNNAAAALMLPIAASAAESENIALEKMAFLLMLAASASFMSPFGYQTNLMVYGPGGYVFADFIKFGFPMQITLLIVSIVV